MFQPEILKLRALTIRPDTGHEVFNLLTFGGQRKGSSPHNLQVVREQDHYA